MKWVSLWDRWEDLRNDPRSCCVPESIAITMIISTISPGKPASQTASFRAYLALNKMGTMQVSKSKPGEEGRCVTDRELLTVSKNPLLDTQTNPDCFDMVLFGRQALTQGGMCPVLPTAAPSPVSSSPCCLCCWPASPMCPQKPHGQRMTRRMEEAQLCSEATGCHMSPAACELSGLPQL